MRSEGIARSSKHQSKMESVPKELRNLRACLVCSLVKVRNSDVIEYRRFYGM